MFLGLDTQGVSISISWALIKVDSVIMVSECIHKNSITREEAKEAGQGSSGFSYNNHLKANKQQLIKGML